MQHANVERFSFLLQICEGTLKFLITSMTFAFAPIDPLAAFASGHIWKHQWVYLLFHYLFLHLHTAYIRSLALVNLTTHGRVKNV